MTRSDYDRRRFLTGAGGTLAVGLAGCLGGGGDDEMTDETTDDGMDGDDEMTDDGDGMEETDDGMMATEFVVTVHNVSDSSTLSTSDGSVPVPLSPVAYAVAEDGGHLFETGEAASEGLERLAEDGSPADLAESLEMEDVHAGTAAVPKGGEDPAPIGPGEAYEFTVEAHDGQHLSLATMFVQSNDLFYAPAEEGIPLYEMEEPVDGDVTDRLALWDAGTEENEEPGVGEHQAPRQMETDSGPDEDGTVRPIDDVDDGYDYPAVGDVVEVTITPGGMDG